MLVFDPELKKAGSVKMPVAVPCEHCEEDIPPRVDACPVTVPQEDLFGERLGLVHADCKTAFDEAAATPGRG